MATESENCAAVRNGAKAGGALERVASQSVGPVAPQLTQGWPESEQDKQGAQLARERWRRPAASAHFHHCGQLITAG